MDNILVIESQSRTKERIFEFLKSETYSLRGFDEAGEALEFLRNSKEAVNLAIIAWDIGGEVGGSELLMRLRQRKIAFPCIVVSSSLDLAISNRAIALGAADVLLKPIDGNRLVESVRKALKDPRIVDPLFHELRKDIIGKAPVLLDAVVKLAQAIRGGDAPILLIGESGVGKEIFAQLVHCHQETHPSKAANKIEAINIASLSSNLIESELFGHEKGSFTGADRRRIGKFEQVEKGTLFLDEIGYLDPTLQPKLLRVIDQRTFYRVGGDQELKFQARLVCATSRNLAEAVRAGTFREDLYYRISGFEIWIPPLRKRLEDICILSEYFLRNTGLRLERETLAVLESYSFPGNVRELQNILSQARAVATGKSILPADLPNKIMLERVSPPQEQQFFWPESLLTKKRDEALREIEKRFDSAYLPHMIGEAGNNKELAAEKMGITPKTLRQKLRDCGLEHLVSHKGGQE